MKCFKRKSDKNEMHLFAEKFVGKGIRLYVEADNAGKIIRIDSENKEVIAYAKKLGLKQDG